MDDSRNCGICHNHVDEGTEVPFDCSRYHVTHAVCALEWYKTKQGGTSHVSCGMCYKKLNASLSNEANVIVVPEVDNNIDQEEQDAIIRDRKFARFCRSKSFIVYLFVLSWIAVLAGMGLGYAYYPIMQEMIRIFTKKDGEIK